MHDKMFGQENLDVTPRWDTWIRPIARSIPVPAPVQKAEIAATHAQEEPNDSDGEEWIELGDPEDSDYEEEEEEPEKPKAVMFDHKNFRVLEEESKFRRSLLTHHDLFGDHVPLSHGKRRFQTFVNEFNGCQVGKFDILKIALEIYKQLRSLKNARTPREVLFVSNNRMLNYVSWAQVARPNHPEEHHAIHMDPTKHTHFGHIWSTVVQSIAHFDSLCVKKIDREAHFNAIVKKLTTSSWRPVVFVNDGAYHCLLWRYSKRMWWETDKHSLIKNVPTSFIAEAVKEANALTCTQWF